MTERTITHGPGVVAPSEPTQTPAFGIKDLQKGAYSITPLAKFTAEARVLSKKRYSSDKLSDLSPLDVMLGWGAMSDEKHLDEILITQSERYFEWQMSDPPIPLHQMVRHTANVHLIPSSPEIRSKILEIRRGHIVTVKGYLVEARTPDGWSHKSSMRRDDFGKEASELVWVNELQLKP
ncbi:hypothetical protein [Halalkalibaculum sp. DA3122]